MTLLTDYSNHDLADYLGSPVSIPHRRLRTLYPFTDPFTVYGWSARSPERNPYLAQKSHDRVLDCSAKYYSGETSPEYPMGQAVPKSGRYSSHSPDVGRRKLTHSPSRPSLESPFDRESRSSSPATLRRFLAERDRLRDSVAARLDEDFNDDSSSAIEMHNRYLHEYSRRQRVDSPYRRSTSASPSRGLRSSSSLSLLRSTSSFTRSGSRSLELGPISSSRPFTVKSLATQRNRHRRDSADNERFITDDKAMFVPRSPVDIRIGDLVKFSRPALGYVSLGEVLYVGRLLGRGGNYVGVELYLEHGEHNGIYNGYRYFKSKPKRGMFVDFENVLLAWAAATNVADPL